MSFRLFQRAFNGVSQRILTGQEASGFLSTDCSDPEKRKHKDHQAVLSALLSKNHLPSGPSYSLNFLGGSPQQLNGGTASGSGSTVGVSVLSEAPSPSSSSTSTQAVPTFATASAPAPRKFNIFGVSSLRDLNPRRLVPAETTAANLSSEGIQSLIPTASPTGLRENNGYAINSVSTPNAAALSNGYSTSPILGPSASPSKRMEIAESPMMSGYSSVTTAVSSLSLSPNIEAPLASPMSEKAKKAHMKRRIEIESLPNRDWNREFNEVFRVPVAERSSQLKSLYHDFMEVASRVGETIIRERNLSPVQKIVQPYECDGIAGGEKFLKKGIFFKYAIDKNSFYGSDEGAMKVAGHELKSYTAMVSCGMSMGLQFGLMTIIDFRGFRLLATSKLPISPKTLKYGSADGGNTVRADLPELNQLMKNCAQVLNLKGHFAGISADPSQRRFLHTPCDIEGHLGRDGKFYVIDLARLFPPETPESFARPLVSGETNERTVPAEGAISRSFLYRLLRPELVRRNKVPLSSDAFTLFGKDGHEEHDREAREATQWLRDSIIPEFSAKLLASTLPGSPRRQMATEATVEWLLDNIHRNGINFRYLAAIRKECVGKDSFWARLILTEIIARTLKSRLRASMRDVSSSSDLSCSKLVASFCNEFLVEPYCRNNPAYSLSSSASSDLIWTEVTRRFGPCPLDPECDADAESVMDLVFPGLLFRRVLTLVGIELSGRNALLDSIPSSPMGSGIVVGTGPTLRLKETDVLSVVGRHKQVYLIPRIEADSAAELARRSHDLAEISRLLTVARDNYVRVLQFKPDDFVVLSNLGTVLVALAKLEPDPTVSSQLFSQAYARFRASLSVKPDDEKSITMWADGCIDQALWMKGRQTNAGSDGSSLQEHVEKLLRCAESLSMKAESICYGSGSYNIARVMALRNKDALCHQWLLRSSPPPSRDQLLFDPSLFSVRSSSWFQSLLSSSH